MHEEQLMHARDIKYYQLIKENEIKKKTYLFKVFKSPRENLLLSRINRGLIGKSALPK
jgi:hypothetical protein